MSLTQELSKIEAELREVGATVTDVCREAGIARSTWRRWSVGETQPNFGTWQSIVEAKDRLVAAGKDADEAAA